MRHIRTAALLAGLLLSPVVGHARQAPPARPAPAQQPPQAVQVVPFDSTRNASQTREQLRQVLQQYPPSVREVLRIDTSLLSRPDYLAAYPVLAAFLEQHPEVAHNPAYFVGESQIQQENRNDPRIEAVRAMRDIAVQITIVFVVLVITAGIIVFIKTLAEQFRWQRAWRGQSALQTKLIDRFASSDELLAYLQSPAGKAMTEMPSMPQPAARNMSAPLGRIFWSLQAGTILMAAGTGFLFVSGRIEEVAPVLSMVGTLLVAIGVGSVVSAGLSFVLSKRLGLIPPIANGYNREAS